jgi:hypothetical protein
MFFIGVVESRCSVATCHYKYNSDNSIKYVYYGRCKLSEGLKYKVVGAGTVLFKQFCFL